MKYIINEEVCNKYNLTLPDFLLLLFLKTDSNLTETLKELIERKVIIEREGNLLIDTTWSTICDNILLNADSEIPTEDSLNTLASTLMNIFPKGKKNGTNYYWRGNKKDIKLRLQKFYKLYGNKFPSETIIKATENYVKSFNGNYTFMRLLKYFIWKDERKIDGEGKSYILETSDLADFIENEGQGEEANDWTSTLK